MSSCSRLTAVLSMATALLLGSSSVLADLYADPSGFSIVYPDGWYPLSKADQGQIQSELPPELKRMLDDKQVDLNRIAVMIMRGGEGEYLEGINVVVENSQIPVSSSKISELTEMIGKQFKSIGADFTLVGSSILPYASRDVYVIDYSVTLPGVGIPLHQRQYLVPGGGKTYIVTCSSTTTAFPTYESTFEEMMRSFQAPEPKKTGFDLGRSGTLGAIGGVVGGLVALMGGLIKALFGGAKKQA